MQKNKFIKPELSILLPVFNAEKYLDASIRSVLNQSFKNFELILIDDGSTDSSLRIIRQYAETDDRVVVIEQKNTGLSSALNAGIAASKAEICARLDADDIALQTRLELQLYFMNLHPDISVAGGWVEVFGEQCLTRTWKNPTSPGEIFLALFLRNPLFHPTVVFRKSNVEAVGGYDTSVVYDQDYDLWLRMSKNGCKFANIPRVLTRYRIHAAQMGYIYAPSTRIDWMRRNLNLALSRVNDSVDEKTFIELLDIIRFEKSSGQSGDKIALHELLKFINKTSPYLPTWVKSKDKETFYSSVTLNYVKMGSPFRALAFLWVSKRYNDKEHISAFFIGILRKIYKRFFRLS